MNEIKLVQKPIIEHQLEKVGKEIDERIKALNLENLVATIDTVKALKKTRAELNKELASFEEQLKLALQPVSDPISEIKELFKTNITEKYSPADELLKSKVSEVENKVKDEKKQNIIDYFNELCAAEEIDFLEFSNLEIEINLSTNEKKYKERVNDFVEKVKDDIALIKASEHEAEIMAEYKKTLNVSRSVQDVKDRKERERIEKERIKQQEYLRRSKILQNIGMAADKETETYVYSAEIYAVWANLKDLEKDEFEKAVIDFEEKIKADKAEKAKAEKANEPVKSPEQKEAAPVAPPIKAPEKVEKLETFPARFEVIATYPELMKLKKYLIDNNLTYKNI